MRLHHVGYVTANVERKAESLRPLGYAPAGPPVVDEIQQVRILMLTTGDGPLLELIEPHGPRSPVQRHLDQGGGLYHLCYEVRDLEAKLREIETGGAGRVVKAPAPAVACGGRRVAFIVTAERDLVEFIEG